VYLYCPPPDQAHYIKVDTRQLKEAYHRMGPMSFPQKVILIDFVGLALLWYAHAPLQERPSRATHARLLIVGIALVMQVQPQGHI
jgi:di/tricarboxylate transporter